SSTVSPARSSASAVGLPQPRDAAIASVGREAISPSVYRLDVIGSAPASAWPQALVEQQEASRPATTFSAAFPYLSLTICLLSWSAMAGSSRDFVAYAAPLVCAQQAPIFARVRPAVRSARREAR